MLLLSARRRFALLVLCLSVPSPAAAFRAEDSDSKLAESLRLLTERLAASNDFSGAVLLAMKEKVLFQGAYGLASRRFSVANRIDTRFNLGSMNKMFTAVAIGQLVESKRLSWDDRLSARLQGWLPEDVASKIRISHLLSHTSGLGSYFNEGFFKASRLRYREVGDYRPLVANDRPAFEPGSSWSYSNTGFLLLGAVIEQVTGQSYFDYVREKIYAPAGMAGTDCYDMDEPVPNLAIGYFEEDGKIRENTLVHVVRGGPAGGGYSTVQDLHGFALALLDDRLISTSSRKLLTSAKPELHSEEYGYGFQVTADPVSFGHSGGFPGISSRLVIYPEEGYVLAVLSNWGEGAMEIHRQVRSLLSAHQ